MERYKQALFLHKETSYFLMNNCLAKMLNYVKDRNKITRFYKIALYAYISPIILLGISILDSCTLDLAASYFLPAFIFTLLPSGVVGIIFTIFGSKISFKEKDYEKKDTGYANLIMGIVMSVIGLLASGFIYMRSQ